MTPKIKAKAEEAESNKRNNKEKGKKSFTIMSAPINQIQSPDDEDEDQTDLVDDCKNNDSAIKEPVPESFLNYYNHDLGKPQDFACFEAVPAASNPLKFKYERVIKEGLDSASPKMKAKKRTAEVVDGGRVVRATGRKDRHSKVRTARGPRDRRVRLSPTTAIQFYDVQDRLGYDRPSKAIDWLINEAKTAIDALEQQPSFKLKDSNVVENHSTPPILNHDYVSLTQCGMRENLKWNDDNLSCFVDEVYLHQDLRNTSEINIYPNSCSALNTTTKILETNWEMTTLQKMFAWNRGYESIRGGGAEYSSGNTLPISGHFNLYSHREPLQSSDVSNSDFSGFNFSNDLSKIAASAAKKQDKKF